MLALPPGDRWPNVKEFFFVCHPEPLAGRLRGGKSKWQRAISIGYKHLEM